MGEGEGRFGELVNVPGWVPLRGSLPFIEFDHLDRPKIVAPPENALLRAWPKLGELERRWLHFEWFTHGVAKRPDGVRTLLDDAASAYLMTFEAVLQVIGDQLFDGSGRKLNVWLRSLPPDVYDITCRGLRTLRHVEAHVRKGNLEIVGHQMGTSVFSGGGWGETLPWCFARLEADALPRWPALDSSEWEEWNALAESNLAARLMREGVRQAFQVGEIAEATLRP